MFELPSVWNIVVSTIVFIVAARYSHRFLEEQGIAQSMVKGLLVFVLAYIASWSSGEVVDWVQLNLEGSSKQETPVPPNINTLMQQLEQLKQK